MIMRVLKIQFVACNCAFALYLLIMAGCESENAGQSAAQKAQIAALIPAVQAGDSKACLNIAKLYGNSIEERRKAVDALRIGAKIGKPGARTADAEACAVELYGQLLFLSTDLVARGDAEFNESQAVLAYLCKNNIHGFRGYNEAHQRAVAERQEFVAHQARFATADTGSVVASSVLQGLGAGAGILAGGSSAPQLTGAGGVGSAGGGNVSGSLADPGCTECGQSSAYQTWMSRCQNRPGAQGPCHCAAATLYRCNIDKGGCGSSISTLQAMYEKEIAAARGTGTQCFTN